MSKSGQWYIAQTYGSEYTLYAAMRKMGIPLTKSQEECQRMLEEKYPPKEDKQ